MKLLLITRKYPPMVGGMEKVSFALAKEFSKQVDTTLITWGKSQKYLPFFLIIALIKSLYIIPRKKITHVYIGDALLSPLGLLLKTIFQIKTSITIHGLDIIFNFPGYQFIIPKSVSQLDQIICVSNATMQECLKRGIPQKKSTVIPWGVYPNEWIINTTRKDLEKKFGKGLKNKKILITVGRLVRRKGVYWFIKNVLPSLDKNIMYLVVGEGPEKERIQKLIKKIQIEKRVMLVGKISHDDLRIIYNTTDLFVMPNIKVPGTIEGFGVVAIEASSTGLPVLASDIEGIQDAVVDGKTGKLLHHMNAQQYITNINNFKRRNKKLISQYIVNNFSWESIGERYLHQII